MSVFIDWPPSILLPREELLPGYLIASATLKNIGLSFFIMISGYLLSSQLANRNIPYITFIKGKFVRIMVPCFIAAFFYWLIFRDNFYIPEIFPGYINGTHLWYLPMLFMIFFFEPLFETYKKNIFILCLFSFLIIVAFLTLNINFRTFYEFRIYLPVFLFGFIFFLKKEELKSMNILAGLREKNNSYKLIKCILLLLAVVCFLVFTYFFSKYGLLFYIFYPFLFIISYYLIEPFKDFLSRNIIIRNVSNQSFTMYLIHPFIINIIVLLIPTFLMNNSLFSVIIILMLSLSISMFSGILYSRVGKKLFK